MDPINIEALGEQIFLKAKEVLGKDWDKYKGVLEEEARSLAFLANHIALLEREGLINEDNAEVYKDMIEDRIKGLKLLLAGLLILTLERLINAVLDLLRAAINTAIGWSLL